jgi:tetratricopeptide (TPR) repeat protein
MTGPLGTNGSRHWVSAVFAVLVLLSCRAHDALNAHADSTELSIETDYSVALQQARERHVPLLVCSGSAWSHYFMWMRATVFTPRGLRALHQRVVPLLIDAERPQNAQFYAKFKTSPWLSVLVIDENTEQTIRRVDAELDAEDLGVLVKERQHPVRDTFELQLEQADRQFAAGQESEASANYSQVAIKAPLDWVHRKRAILSAMFTDAGPGGCAGTARRFIDDGRAAPLNAQSAFLALKALECALDDPPSVASRADQIAWFESRLNAFVSAASEASTLADITHSQIYRELVRAREFSKDVAGAKEVARHWWAWLDRQYANAIDGKVRAVFDVHRQIAAVTMEQPELAVPAILKSQAEFPNDYNPPARLASLYRRIGQFERAIEASEKAMARVYGSYGARVLLGRSDTLISLGKREQAIDTVKAAIALVKSLDSKQVPDWLSPQLDARLKELTAQPQPATTR